MQRIWTNRGRAALTISTVAMLGLLAADAVPASADPPPHARARGYYRTRGEDYDRERDKREAERERERDKREAELERERDKREAERERERDKHEAELERERDKREREREKREAELERERDDDDYRSSDYRRRYEDRPRVRVRTLPRSQSDLDRDGIPNHRDRDIDGDRVPNNRDRYPRDRTRR